MTSTSRETEKKVGKGRSLFKQEFGDPERRTAYFMVLPALLIILIVAFWPGVSAGIRPRTLPRPAG